jgi:hypothetical protein
MVKLSGFMQTGDQWKALLAVTTENPDPRAAGLSYYLTLAEGDKQRVGTGEKQGMVELVKLDAGQETVDIINSGMPVNLTMKDNGFESPPSASPVLPAQRPVHVYVPPSPTPPVNTPGGNAPVAPGTLAGGAPGAVASAVKEENSGPGVSPAVGNPPSVGAPRRPAPRLPASMQ